MLYLKLKMLSDIWVLQKYILEIKIQKDIFNCAATQSKMNQKSLNFIIVIMKSFLEHIIVETC